MEKVKTSNYSRENDQTFVIVKFTVPAAASTEYTITVTDGKATAGAGNEISKAAEGTTVTLTANAAPDGKAFDKWVVVSGSITLADKNSATTTFTMPASAVSMKATYKDDIKFVNKIEATVTAPELGATPDYHPVYTSTPENSVVLNDITWSKIAKADFTGTDADVWDLMGTVETFTTKTEKSVFQWLLNVHIIHGTK